MNDNPDVQDLICMQGNLKKSVIVQRQHKLVKQRQSQENKSEEVNTVTATPPALA